jgi:hypothetical protein
MTHRLRTVVFLALATAVGVAAQQRDQPPQTSGTASISGSVVLAGPGREPARRVRVTLTNLARTSPGQTTTTDDTGAFAFAGLPAGRFELQAFKAAYLRSSYGASRPDRAGTPIVLRDGERIASLSMTMVRGAVISGTVRNKEGRAVPGVNVRVLRLGYNAVTGERTLGLPSSGSAAMTDDRGQYRAYGLPPGGYLVLVPDAGRTGGGNPDEFRVLSSAEVRQAMQQASRAPTASPATGSTGPTPAPSSPTPVSYAPVFHPGVTHVGAASTVTLVASEERGNIDVVLQLVPTSTISGTITSPAGALPPMLGVGLVPSGHNTEMLSGAGLRGQSATLRPDGTYEFSGIPPGSYTIKARVGYGRGTALPNGPALWASADVAVNGNNLNVPLVLQPGVTIHGRVVFEGAQPTAVQMQALSFKLLPLGSGGALLSSGGGRVDAEGRFTFGGIVPDTYQFLTQWTDAAASGRWTIKNSVANGRDAFESPLRVMPNQAVEWTITYTDLPTAIAGIFQDRGGRAATDYYMLLFPADRNYWTPGSRRIRTTRPDSEGAFSLKGLPPGDYLLAALTDLENGEWNDPALLEQVLPAAARVTLRDGQTTNQDFRIGGG